MSIARRWRSAGCPRLTFCARSKAHTVQRSSASNPLSSARPSTTDRSGGRHSPRAVSGRPMPGQVVRSATLALSRVLHHQPARRTNDVSPHDILRCTYLANVVRVTLLTFVRLKHSARSVERASRTPFRPPETRSQQDDGERPLPPEPLVTMAQRGALIQPRAPVLRGDRALVDPTPVDWYAATSLPHLSR